MRVHSQIYGKGMRYGTQFIACACLFFILAGGFFFASKSFTKSASAQTPSPSSPQKSELEQQLAALEREAAELDGSLQKTRGEVRTLANQKLIVETEVKRKEVEIKRLSLAIQKALLEAKRKSEGIGVLSQKISTSRKTLSAMLLLVHAQDRETPLRMLLKYDTLSDFFGTLYDLERVQTRVQVVLNESKEDRAFLEKERNELQEFQEEQEGLKALQEVERKLLAQKKKEKEELLRLTKGKEEIFQKLLTSKKRDIASLRTQLFYLEKTGITAEEAVRLADLAAKRSGIRTAFLLALLEVETGKQFEDGVISVGTNLGTGNWKTDLYECYISLRRPGAAEAEKKAFFAITEKLKLDPDRMPVSRQPNYGCGGAMGPAQFLPTTWLRFEEQVGRLTTHNPPNPWNVEDAFTAAAVFLAEAGASSKTSGGEIAAAKTYLSGNPSCSRSICRYYSNRVVALAQEIDRIL
ncbi:MAG: hypothetical protein G01um101466_674 [Parcubacteria group bacterium Gr01-1014_66]|nr:MAG: hypothetical protein G01um101466_674 [Parcubacteria group bacterium Gr01-1014_66]